MTFVTFTVATDHQKSIKKVSYVQEAQTTSVNLDNST